MALAEMIAALDIGGTKIAAGIVVQSGCIVSRTECATAPGRGFEDALARMIAMLCEVSSQAGASIGGIGIGCTGPVDPFRGTVEKADLLPGWDGAPLAARLSEAFGVRVALENDADAAALGEAAWGIGRGKDRFILVTFGTGIGGGFVLHGTIYRGVDGSHPEFGHHVVEASGPQCYCGARGCWEMLASGPALEHACPGAQLTAREICERAEQGDTLALRAVERVGHYLGVGLANLVTLFSPDAIALGGGLMRSSRLFLDRAREIVRRNCTLVPHEKILVAPASLGADAGLAGAARVWQSTLER